MVDAFGYRWSVNITPSGPGQYQFSGQVDIGGGVLWRASGTASRSGGGYDTYWRADNPQADGCASGLTDYFEYFGSGGRTQSGSWTSYCSGSPVGSGTWSGTISAGACP